MIENRAQEEPQELGTRLAAHPVLRARVEHLLALIEGGQGERLSAAAAEDQVGEQLRGLGQATLQAWAETQQQRQEQYWEARAGVNRKEKKARLVHALRGDKDSGATLSGGAQWGGGASVCGGGGDSVSRLFGPVAASAGGFWGGGVVWASGGAGARTLWDRGAGECGAAANGGARSALASAAGSRAVDRVRAGSGRGGAGDGNRREHGAVGRHRVACE